VSGAGGGEAVGLHEVSQAPAAGTLATPVAAQGAGLTAGFETGFAARRYIENYFSTRIRHD
jgi:hypothetical protein